MQNMVGDKVVMGGCVRTTYVGGNGSEVACGSWRLCWIPEVSHGWLLCYFSLGLTCETGQVMSDMLVDASVMSQCHECINLTIFISFSYESSCFSCRYVVSICFNDI